LSDRTQGAADGPFFTRFSDLLTPSERERLAELKKTGIPQHIHDEVNDTADDYWKTFKLAEPQFSRVARPIPPVP
jgi:hypothetical protein